MFEIEDVAIKEIPKIIKPVVLNSGVYKIENIVTKECYIGSTKDLTKRWTVHRHELKNKIHHSKPLQNSWDSFGEDYLFLSS